MNRSNSDFSKIVDSIRSTRSYCSLSKLILGEFLRWIQVALRKSSITVCVKNKQNDFKLDKTLHYFIGANKIIVDDKSLNDTNLFKVEEIF